METILKKITDKVPPPTGAMPPLQERIPPQDILPILKDSFFMIAEVKKGSPSKGIIRENFNPIEIAKAYESAGASAISVLTEEHFFFGKKDFLPQIKEEVTIPLLRKDFLIYPYQIHEAYNLGADFLLLIVACLTDSMLSELYKLTRNLGMQALVEVHNHEELERALKINPDVIGINNRNLKTFEVDMLTSFQLKEEIPDDIFVISESGIQSNADILDLREGGFAGALVGETLMRQKDVTVALKELLHG